MPGPDKAAYARFQNDHRRNRPDMQDQAVRPTTPVRCGRDFVMTVRECTIPFDSAAEKQGVHDEVVDGQKGSHCNRFDVDSGESTYRPHWHLMSGHDSVMTARECTIPFGSAAEKQGVHDEVVDGQKVSHCNRFDVDSGESTYRPHWHPMSGHDSVMTARVL